MSLLSLILPVVGQPDSTEDIKVANALTAIQTWAAGNIDNTNWSAIAWSVYTPLWTAVSVNPVIGNGLLTGKWQALGKSTAVRLILTLGTTTTLGTGFYFFSLPVTSKLDGEYQTLSGFISQAGVIKPIVATISSHTATLVPYDVTGTQLSSSTSLAAGDIVVLQGVVEAA